MKLHTSVLGLISILSLSVVLAVAVNHPVYAACTSPGFTGFTGDITASNTGWSLTVNGCGFGAYPSVSGEGDVSVATQPSSTTGSIILVDQGPTGTSNNWGAGFGGDIIGILLSSGSWSSTQFVINGFGGAGVCEAPCGGFPISPGDQIYLYMVGPGCTSGQNGAWPSSTNYPNTPPPVDNWPTDCMASQATALAACADSTGASTNLCLGPIVVQATSTGVPEFPLATFVPLLMLAGLLPLLFVFRRRWGTGWVGKNSMARSQVKRI